MIRPTDGVAIRGDRARAGSRHASEPVTVAFRVHYAYEADSSKHHVTEPMWEHEAVEFADRVASFPGMRLVASPDRPRGIESVRGWDRVSRASALPDTESYLIAKAKRLAEAARDALADGDAPAAASIMTELAEFTARQTVEATRVSITTTVASVLATK